MLYRDTISVKTCDTITLADRKCGELHGLIGKKWGDEGGVKNEKPKEESLELMQRYLPVLHISIRQMLAVSVLCLHRRIIQDFDDSVRLGHSVLALFFTNV